MLALILTSLALFILLLAVMTAFAIREIRAQRRFDELDFEIKTLKANLKDTLEGKLAFEKAIASMKEVAQKQEKRIEELKKALNANSFDGRFPICSNCKDIRDEGGCWHSIEEFIAGLSEADFSHSLCPDCARKLYPDMFEEGKKLHTLTWK